MLEVVIPGMRYGEAKINSSSAYRGCHCYIAGLDAEGYQLLQLPYTSVHASKSYPVTKLYFEEENGDTSNAVDKLTKGDTIVYFDGGEYITSKWAPGTFGFSAAYWASLEAGLVSTAYGSKLYSPGTSTAAGTISATPKKVYVATGAGTGHGYLTGSTAHSRGSSSGWTTTGEKHIGFVVGVYAEDSVMPLLRYRVSHGIGGVGI